MKKLLLSAVAAFILAYIPFTVYPGTSVFAAAAVTVAGFLLGIVFLRALKRQEDLAGEIALELNKVRRIYHLGKNLGGEGRLRQWFTDLHGHLYGYLTSFDKKDFSQYQETNAAFRKLSYHLYQIPDLQTDKERVLYRELLEAAGTVAGARQRIQELWNGGVAPAAWNGLVVMSAFAGAGVLLSKGSQDQLLAGIALTVLAAAVTVVRDVDRMKTLSGAVLAKRYVENIARLELRRHEEA